MRAGIAGLLVIAGATGRGAAATRTITFDTREVTEAAVALSPAGTTLVFTMLGHLFEMPVAAKGEARQLTFGPYYDGDPVFSPNGAKIAFVSDRGASEGRELGVYVLDLATKAVSAVTKDTFAIRPTFTASGDAVAYLSTPPEPAYPGSLLLRRVALAGGDALTLRPDPAPYRSVFRLRDGRLAWSIAESKPAAAAESRIETLLEDGRLAAIATCDGILERVESSPSGRTLFARRMTRRGEDIVAIAPGGKPGTVRSIARVDATRGPRPRFAVGRTAKLYLGDEGHLYAIDVGNGTRAVLPMRARVRLEIDDPVPAKPAGAGPSPTILNPVVAPDGSLIFEAAGRLWMQRSGGSQATVLDPKDERRRAFASSPALSPDGKRLAYVRSEGNAMELRVMDLAAGSAKSIATGSGYGSPAWSPDGRILVAVESAGFQAAIVAFGSDGGSRMEIAPAGFWSARPNFSPDGRWLYTTANVTGTGNVYRRSAGEPGSDPEPVTALSRHASDGLVSRDGKWLAFRRNKEIWIAPIPSPSRPIADADVRRLADEGGDGFSFSPDSSAVVYAADGRVYAQPVGGGARASIAVRLELPKPVPPPVLIRNARLLDFDANAFGPPASIYVEDGRIRWIGAERGRTIPEGVTTLDASGKFAIPGLFEMHAHAAGANQEAFIAYGVTSVRDTGGSIVGSRELADRAETSPDPIPRYVFAGEIFEGEHPYWGDGFLQITSEDDARAYVRRFKAAGASFIKVYPSLPWPLQLAVVDEARSVGIPVVGHGMSVNEITRSVTHGFSTIEHTIFPLRVYDDVLRMLAASETRWDPTLAVMGGDALLLRKEPGRLEDAKLRGLTPLAMIASATTEGYEKDVPDVELAKTWAAELASLRDAHRRGVKLAIGTDAPNPACFYGASLHWELEFFAAAGIPPVEVLRIATAEAAKAVGAADLGILAPGKLADLVLLDANPLDNIKNTQAIWRTVKGGWIFEPPATRLTSSGEP